MNWAAWLSSMVPSLVGRVLAALGMGVVTITGLTLVGDQIRGYIVSSLAGWPADLLQLAGLAGLGDGLNIILGAIAARLALYVLTSSSRIIGTAT